MSRANRLGLYPVNCSALLCGCAATTPTDLFKPEALAPQVLNKVESAELTVINASGWTLTPSNQNILDNGKLLVEPTTPDISKHTHSSWA